MKGVGGWTCSNLLSRSVSGESTTALTCPLRGETACRGHIPPFTFASDLWGRSSCSMPGCYETHTQRTRSPAATRAPQQTARHGRAMSMNAEVNLKAEAVLSSSND
ncbi:hypothetical protein C0J45_21852 [Silurus meridionalis]|nr:hypothetical protein C0J45_21852 [Silurus meridionalis]